MSARKRKNTDESSSKPKKQKQKQADPPSEKNIILSGPLPNLQAMESYINAPPKAPDEKKESEFAIFDATIDQRVNSFFSENSLPSVSKLTISHNTGKRSLTIPQTLGEFQDAGSLSDLHQFNSVTTLADKANETAVLLDEPKKTEKTSSMFIKKAPVFVQSQAARSNLTSSNGRRTVLIEEAQEEEKQDSPNVPVFNFEHLDQSSESAMSQKIKQSINSNLRFMNINSTALKADEENHLSTFVDWFTENSAHVLKNYKPPTEPPKPYTVPILSRAYTENFLQGPIPQLGQRPCVSGLRCVSVLQATKRIAQGFEDWKQISARGGAKEDLGVYILQEFLTPYMAEQRTRVLLEHPECKDWQQREQLINENFKQVEMCYLCHLRVVSEMGIRHGVRVGIVPQHVIQAFGNIFDQPGEYKSYAQLACGADYKRVIVPILRCDETDRMPAIKRVTARYYASSPHIIQTVTKAHPIPVESTDYGTVKEVNGTQIKLRLPRNKFEMFTTHNTTPNNNQGTITASSRIVRDVSDDSSWTQKPDATPEYTAQMMRNPVNAPTLSHFTQKKFTEPKELEQYETFSVFGWVESASILYTQDNDPMTHRANSNMNTRLKKKM